MTSNDERAETATQVAARQSYRAYGSPLDERYEHDHEFQRLVTMCEHWFHEGTFAPADIRAAATYAAIRYEMRRGVRFIYNQKTGELVRVD